MRSAVDRAEIRRRFRVLRMSIDQTQRDVAITTNIPLSRYRDLEIAYADPTPIEAQKLARVFGISIETFRARIEPDSTIRWTPIRERRV